MISYKEIERQKDLFGVMKYVLNKMDSCYRIQYRSCSHGQKAMCVKRAVAATLYEQGCSITTISKLLAISRSSARNLVTKHNADFVSFKDYTFVYSAVNLHIKQLIEGNNAK